MEITGEQIIKCKDREELLEIAKKLGVENPNTLSMEPLRRETYNTFSMLRSLKTQEMVDEVKKKLEEFSAFVYDSETVDSINTKDASFHLQNLLKVSAPSDVESDEYKDFQNLKNSYKNSIRRKFGLSDLNMQYTDADLKDLLLLDFNEKFDSRWTLGKNCSDFLNSIKNPALKGEHERRLNDIIVMENYKIDSAERARNEEYQITKDFESLKNAPSKLFRNDEGLQQVNPNYEEYQESLKKKYREWKLKELAFTQSNREVPEYLAETLKNADGLCKEHLGEVPQLSVTGHRKKG